MQTKENKERKNQLAKIIISDNLLGSSKKKNRFFVKKFEESLNLNFY